MRRMKCPGCGRGVFVQPACPFCEQPLNAPPLRDIRQPPAQAKLPALSDRSTRVLLLAWTRNDALTGGTMDGGGADSHGARLMLHGDLWPRGSYRELEQALERVDVLVRRLFLIDHAGERTAAQMTDRLVRFGNKRVPMERMCVHQVGMFMPANIYVPAEIAEVVGYLPSDAGMWTMPERERVRRWARTAA